MTQAPPQRSRDPLLRRLRVGTRRSQLALWQADYVANLLSRRHPGLTATQIEITTEGDRRTDVSLAAIGGKGLFLKELDAALLGGDVDIAVHSMKDVPAQVASGVEIAAICERADPRDALISRGNLAFEHLPQGARIGSCSLRRRCFLAASRGDLRLDDLRGNVPTRLRKLHDGEFDAIVLAVAGLQRLNLAAKITAIFSVDDCLPAIGQGAIGVACRADDDAVKELLAGIDDAKTHREVVAEREVTRALGGDCHAPIAAYATHHGDSLSMKAVVGAVDGSRLLQATAKGPAANAAAIGARAGATLIDQGALELLAADSNTRPDD